MDAGNPVFSGLWRGRWCNGLRYSDFGVLSVAHWRPCGATWPVGNLLRVHRSEVRHHLPRTVLLLLPDGQIVAGARHFRTFLVRERERVAACGVAHVVRREQFGMAGR